MFLACLVLAAAPIETVVQSDHAYPPSAWAYTRDQRFLVTATVPGVSAELKVWETATGRLLNELRGGGCDSVVTGPGPSDFYCTVYSGSTLRSAEDLKRVLSQQSQRIIKDSPDHRLQLVGDSVVDVASKATLFTLPEKQRALLRFSDNGHYLLEFVAVENKQVVTAFDARTGRQVLQQRTSAYNAEDVDVAPDGKSVAASEKAEVRLYPSGRVITRARFTAGAVRFLSDGKSLAAILYDHDYAHPPIIGRHVVVDVASGKERKSFALKAPRGGFDHGPRPGTYLWVPHQVVMFDQQTLQPISTIGTGRYEPSHTTFFSADGKRLFVHSDNALRAWDLETAAPLWSMPVERQLFAVDPARKTAVVYLGNTGGNQLAVVDLETGKEKRRFKPFKLEPPVLTEAGMSADGSLVAVNGMRGSVAVFRVADGTPVCRVETYEGDMLHNLRFSDATHFEGTHGYPRDVVTYDVSTCQEVARRVPGHQEYYVRNPLFASRAANDNYLFATPHPSNGLTAYHDSQQALDRLVVKRGEQTLFSTTSEDPISAIAFDPTAPLIATVAPDATAALWRYDDKGAQLVVRLVAKDEGFAALTPDGYFRTSREGRSFLHYRQGGRTFSFDNFDTRFNRPDIVAERIGKASPATMKVLHAAWQARNAKLPPLTGDLHVPDLTIARDKVALSVAQPKTSLTVQAGDTQQAVTKLRVFVNGVPVLDKPWPIAAGQTATQTITVPLSYGDNRISVSVVNAEATESRREDVRMKRTGVQPKVKTYVAAIGVSRYADASKSLEYAAKDASDVARSLGTETLVITDASGTKEALARVKQFFAKATVDDRVVLFIAGHGLLDDKLDYWFATHDVSFENPAQRGLAYSDLERAFDDSPALQRLMLMDTCHAGELDKETVALVAQAESAGKGVKARAFRGLKKLDAGERAPVQLLRELFSDAPRSNGATVIASAGGAEFALESSDYKNGVFTYALISGLNNYSREADSNRDGALRVSEMLRFVAAKVSDLTAGAQRPAARADNIEYDFVLR